MKDIPDARLSQYRLRMGPYRSDDSFGNTGAFEIPFQGRNLLVIASEGLGWDHVSVSLKNRTPNWQEMCFIKSIFFDEEETVWQYHPPKSQYVNQHEFCLHLWRKQDFDMPLPAMELVGLTK